VVITTLLVINLGEAEEKRFQLFEPEGRVLETPGANLKFIEKCCRQVKMNLSNILSEQDRDREDLSGCNHSNGIHGALFCAETASHTFCFIIENFAWHFSLRYGTLYMEGLGSTQIDTKHA